MLNVSGILQTHFTILHFVTCISCLFEVDVSNERITTYSNRKLFNPVIPGRFCTCWNDGMKAPALSNIPVSFVYMYYNGKHSEGYPIATFVHVLILWIIIICELVFSSLIILRYWSPRLYLQFGSCLIYVICHLGYTFSLAHVLFTLFVT